MEFDQFLSHLRREGGAAVGLASGDLDAAVPGCPGWTAGDVVAHLAQVYEHKIQCTRLGVEPDPWPPAWPPERDLAEWLSDAHRRLLEMLEVLGPEAPSATWYPPDQTVGFWARRMAHETVIHRVDLEQARGEAGPVSDELAADGIDEILTVMLAGDWSDAPKDGCCGQRALVSSAGRDWLVTLDRSWVEVKAGTGEAEAAIRGAPSDLDLWLWGRAGETAVETSGDPSVAPLLRGRLRLATQ